jgi:hypothetical protein
MSMIKSISACFILATIFMSLMCSKAPIPYIPPDNPDAQERIVLGEFFTQDM